MATASGKSYKFIANGVTKSDLRKVDENKYDSCFRMEIIITIYMKTVYAGRLILNELFTLQFV
jgi:hypothetical protein